MNQTFSLHRWLLLINCQWQENKKKYIYSLIGIAGLLVMMYAFLMAMPSNNKEMIKEGMQFAIYFAGLFLSGCIFSGMYFSNLSSTASGIHFLHIPASHFEKILAAFFYTTLVFFFCYTAIFTMINTVMVHIADGLLHKYLLTHPTNEIIEKPVFFNVFTTDIDGMSMFLTLWLILQSFFLLGSIYFKKMSLGKTIAVVLVFYLITFLLGTNIQQLLPSGGFTGINFSRFEIFGDHSSEQHYHEVVTLPQWFTIIFLFIFRYILVLVFWIATYFRLKEKEV